MREVRLGETTLLECERCRGMWVDAATFEHICADREAQAAVLQQWPVVGAQGKPSAANRAAPVEVHYRKCVACGKLMNRLNFGRLSGTVVDACKGHGTFLDAGELHQIVSFIQGGGLERARQQQLDDLKDAERNLRSLQAGGTGGTPMTFESPLWSAIDLLALLDHLTPK
jgi:Zn-finger nucleic acid-binding protein